MIFTWKEKVRVRVGEITRKQQFALWQQISDMGEVENLQLAMEEISETITSNATRQVEVCMDGHWVTVGEAQPVSLNEDEFVVAYPVTPVVLQNLPRSLADAWITAALDANGNLNELLSFPSARRVNTPSTNEPASDSGASSEPNPTATP